MLELGWFSLRLFLKGKLLRSPGYVFRQTFIAWGIGTLLMVLLSLPPIPICIPITIST